MTAKDVVVDEIKILKSRDLHEEDSEVQSNTVGQYNESL